MGIDFLQRRILGLGVALREDPHDARRDMADVEAEGEVVVGDVPPAVAHGVVGLTCEKTLDAAYGHLRSVEPEPGEFLLGDGDADFGCRHCGQRGDVLAGLEWLGEVDLKVARCESGCGCEMDLRRLRLAGCWSGGEW